MADVPTYPKLREDISFHRVVMRGQETFIVKDPVRRKYMQFDPLGYRLCQLLDGGHTLEDLVVGLSEEFPDYDFDVEYVRGYLEHLIDMKLVFRDKFEYNVLLMERVRREREKHNTLLHMSFTAIDPDDLLTWLMERLQWVTSRPFVIFYWAFVIGSYAVLLGNFSAAWHGLSTFYVFSGWSVAQIVALYILIILIIVVHEFGHGLSCKYYGGEVHQMGVLIIYLINPALFCNVSDSYRFPSKFSRMMVIFGGPFVEMFIGSLFVYIWWLSDPTLHIHDFAFKIVIFSSITSWMFNMNPLLKYDGYYALSEAVDIPNLRKRAFQYLGYVVKHGVFGLPAELPVGGKRERRIYLVFSIAAFVYSLMIFSIIYHLLKGWLVGGLAGLGWILLLFLMYTLLKKPLRKGLGFMRLVALDRSGMVGRHLPLVITGLVLLLTIPSIVRVPTVEKRLGILEAYEQTDLEAPAPSQVVDLRTDTGSVVHAGDLLAVLKSNSLGQEIASVERQRDRARALAATAASMGRSQEADRYQSEADRLDQGLGILLDRQALLEVRAPHDGKVLTGRLADLEYRFVSSGELLMQVGRVDSLRVRLEIPERDMADVQMGSLVKFKPASMAWSVARGRIIVIDLIGERAEDREAYYGVEILIDNAELGLVPGQRGQVKMYGRKRSLWGQALHKTIQTLRLDFFL